MTDSGHSSLRRARIAALTTLERGDALRRLVHDLRTWQDAIARQDDRIQKQSYKTVFADLWLFAMALGALRRCAHGGVQLGVDGRKDLKAFDECVPKAKQIRDVLEHLEDYSLGTGAMQLAAEYGARPVEHLLILDGGWALQLQGAAGAQHLDLVVGDARVAADRLVEALVPRALTLHDSIAPPLPDPL